MKLKDAKRDAQGNPISFTLTLDTVEGPKEVVIDLTK
jgi:hypothetical protein